MQYQIISFNKQTGSIEVQYKHNEEVVGVWNIDIPIGEDGNYITGTELEARILAQYPSWVTERIAKLKAGVPNEAAIESLVVPLPEPEQLIELPQPKTVGTQEA